MRTNPEAKKQQGISIVLVEMNTPGVTVRPIRLIDGGYEVNEVFFDNVRIPADQLVGEENRGWDYASSCSATSGPASQEPASSRPGSRG